MSAGPDLVLTVELLPGQLVEDVSDVAHRLAPALGVPLLLVEPYGLRWARLRLLDVDPLADAFHAPLDARAGSRARLVLGRTETGEVITHALADAAHLLVQGGTGSGKSRWTYGLLSQCAHAPDVIVAGSDVSGLLLGSPWDGTRHREHQAAGTRDLTAHAERLDALVAEMDRRLDAMPRGVDELAPGPDLPLVLCVLEEFPGLLRALGALPKPAPGERRPVDRVRAAVLRLLSEGRKVAFRVLMVAQRAEAEAVGGGYARDQFGLVVSFAVPADSLVMGHGEDARELGATHRHALPGVAVVSAPGHPLTRMRSPLVGDYAAYCAAVAPAVERPTLRIVDDVEHRADEHADDELVAG